MLGVSSRKYGITRGRVVRKRFRKVGDFAKILESWNFGILERSKWAMMEKAGSNGGGGSGDGGEQVVVSQW